MSEDNKESTGPIKGPIAWVKVALVIVLTIIAAMVFNGLIIMPIGLSVAGILFLFLEYRKRSSNS